MFTKEHYENVARIISAQRNAGENFTGVMIEQRLDALAEDFADYFEQDNELFARKAFIKACNAASRSEIRRLVSTHNAKVRNSRREQVGDLTLGQYQKGQRLKAAARRRNEKW